MHSALPRVGAWTLAREDIRALPRNLFALSAVALVLALFVPLAAFGFSAAEDFSDSLIFTWVVGELVVAIVVAARVAAARRSRFVDSLYTTPLEQRTWFLSQALVGAFLALLILAVQVPFLLVHVAFVGLPVALPALVAAALGMAAFAIALGLFCGVVVGDAGPGAASGMAGGIAFLAFVLFIVHGVVVTGPPSAAQGTLLRATALSPLTLVIDGTGIDLFDVAPADGWRPLVGLAGMVAGLAGAAWWSYTRAQGPIGWERRGGRSVIVALVALAVLAPVASAEVSYRETEDSDAPLYLPGEHTQVAFVARGAAIHDETFTLSEIYDAPDLPLGEDVALDALVLVLVPDDTPPRGVRIAVHGSADVRVVEGGLLQVPDGRPSGRASPGAGWDSVAEGLKPVYRVPVVLRAVAVESISDAPSLVEVRTEMLAGGRAMTSTARMSLDGEIQGGTTALALAGAPIPLAALAAIVTRKIRTR